MIELLHGTADQYVDEILEEGFRFGPRHVGASVKLYLTDDEMTAGFFARMAAWQAETDRGAIFHVHVPERELRADLMAYEAPLAIWLREHGIPDVATWCQAVLDGEIEIPDSIKDWETSLDVVHAVYTKKTIPARNVEFVGYVDLPRRWKPSEQLESGALCNRFGGATARYRTRV